MSCGRMNAGLLLMAAGLAVAQTNGTPASKSEDKAAPLVTLPPAIEPEMPPEEGASDATKVYSFNPVQSKREVTAGYFYFKKGNFTAAVSRFDAATKWDDGNAEAWMMLGETQEKRSNAKAARASYEKYLELAPDSKNAAEIKKRLAKLKG